MLAMVLNNGKETRITLPGQNNLFTKRGLPETKVNVICEKSCIGCSAYSDILGCTQTNFNAT